MRSRRAFGAHAVCGRRYRAVLDRRPTTRNPLGAPGHTLCWSSQPPRLDVAARVVILPALAALILSAIKCGRYS